MNRGDTYTPTGSGHVFDLSKVPTHDHGCGNVHVDDACVDTTFIHEPALDQESNRARFDLEPVTEEQYQKIQTIIAAWQSILPKDD